jgi:hypothetical protein
MYVAHMRSRINYRNTNKTGKYRTSPLYLKDELNFIFKCCNINYALV